MHPLVSDIQLAWEHGELREVDVTLRGKHSEQEALQILQLTPQPQNVMSVSVQDCSSKDTCVVIQGFDHQGCGD